MKIELTKEQIDQVLEKHSGGRQEIRISYKELCLLMEWMQKRIKRKMPHPPYYRLIGVETGIAQSLTIRDDWNPKTEESISDYESW